ncbi:MAG: hypothetical protein A2Z72_02200 [Omnitrophica bacterium RBG_13_46_9]|nr:MAG: hypothetical protein A2Z72_02200 [Omnitrophica bacterium RBG_13_46_9]
MPKKISEMGAHKDIRIPLEVSNRFFENLNIDPETSYLMDVKKAIFKFYDIKEEPVMTIMRATKTLAQQKPNNAYGIPITNGEVKLFMERFGLLEEDEFTAISKRIIQSVINI